MLCFFFRFATILLVRRLAPPSTVIVMVEMGLQLLFCMYEGSAPSAPRLDEIATVMVENWK